MEKFCLQLLSCLYLYDSGIPVPVCIRKPSQSTDYRPTAFIYRAVGQQTPGTGVDIPCRRSTDSWHRREVCAKSVDRRLASKGLKHKQLSLQSNCSSNICSIKHNTFQSNAELSISIMDLQQLQPAGDVFHTDGPNTTKLWGLNVFALMCWCHKSLWTADQRLEWPDIDATSPCEQLTRG